MIGSGDLNNFVGEHAASLAPSQATKERAGNGGWVSVLGGVRALASKHVASHATTSSLSHVLLRAMCHCQDC
eukprot:6486250-Amphidinium_carterae.1